MIEGINISIRKNITESFQKMDFRALERKNNVNFEIKRHDVSFQID